MRKLVYLLILAVFLGGCTTTSVERKYAEMPEYVREQPSVQNELKHNEGSLWTPSSENIFSDEKARHVGDIVTILVQEQATSQYSSSLKTKTSSSSSAGLSALLGFQNRVLNKLDAVPGAGGIWNTNSSGAYQGSGENKVANKLIATITARVVKVLPNHRLFIRGEKQVYTNGEENTLIITGIIDEYQISGDDTIDSGYISDAKIFFNGKGIAGSTRHEGWLAKLWRLIKPF